jgi:diamine N-acetyltransferase
VIDEGLLDRRGRRITLHPVDDGNWRAVADVVPRDDQRDVVPPSAARYLLLGLREGVWQNLAVVSGDEVVGHVMWAWDDDDGAPWIGGMLVDAAHQGAGVGRAVVVTLARWLLRRPDTHVVRLSVDEGNAAARRLYASVGFVELDRHEDGEVVAEVTAEILATA